MKTKIVYCLVSDRTDYYYEQLLISLCSLRKHNLDANVEVICDQDTFSTLTSIRRGIFEHGIHVVPVEVPKNWRKTERSRYLKSNLRRLVRGDYLYIDTDTIICSKLDSIDDIDCDIAAVLDSHLERPLPKFSKCRHHTEKWIWGVAHKADIDITGLWQYNGGVLYVKDSPKAYELYKRWAEKYSEFLKYGIVIDQLSLLLSNHEMGNVISDLDAKFNCMVSFKEGRELVNNAAIIHYFPGQKKNILSSPWILDPIKETGKINTSIIKVIDNPCAFFKTESRIVIGDEMVLLSTPLVDAYRRSPKILNSIILLLENYHKLKDMIWNLKKKLN